jgi:hypothetical protein
MNCLRFQYAADSFETSLAAVHSRSHRVAVSDAPTDRSDLRRLNRLSELSPAMTLSAMRRLIDSDRSPAFSLLVPHPCSCTRGRSVGAFSSVRRADRLRIASGHARHRIRGFTRGRWVSGGRTSQPSVQWQKSLCVSVQPPKAPFADLERVRSRSTRCCGSAKREVCSRRAGTAQQGLSLGSATTSRGTHRVPRQRRRNDPLAVLGRLARGERLANPTPSRAVHLDDRSKMT